MKHQHFALAIALAATSFLAAGCGSSDPNCVNGKRPDGSVCSSSSSGGSSGGHWWSKGSSTDSGSSSEHGGFGGHSGESGG